MKQAVCVLLFICLATLPVASQTEADSQDDVIIAYWIPEDVEETFDPGDGEISSFWDIWDTFAEDGYENSIDKIRMVPSQNEDCRGHGEGFDGDDDAQIEFRMCWGDKGLYLFAECVDDYWAELGVDSIDISMADWAYDYCDLLFDRLNRQEMIEAGSSEDPAIFGRPGRYAWTKTHVQFLYRFGGSEPAQEFVMYKYEDEIDNRYKYTLNFDDAQDILGDFYVELITTEEQNVRRMEWLIPWSALVNDGMDKPDVLDNIGFEAGYNDNDGEPLETCHLRKYVGEGHWIRTFTLDQTTGDTLDTILHYGSYMNLEFGHGFPGHPEPVINPMHTRAIQHHQAQPARTEYFDLRGRRITPGVISSRAIENGVTIRRIYFADCPARTEYHSPLSR
jgi:hypothetical protein